MGLDDAEEKPMILIRRVEKEDVRGVTQHRNNNNNDMNMTIIALDMKAY